MRTALHCPNVFSKWIGSQPRLIDVQRATRQMVGKVFLVGPRAHTELIQELSRLPENFRNSSSFSGLAALVERMPTVQRESADWALDCEGIASDTFLNFLEGHALLRKREGRIPMTPSETVAEAFDRLLEHVLPVTIEMEIIDPYFGKGLLDPRPSSTTKWFIERCLSRSPDLKKIKVRTLYKDKDRGLDEHVRDFVPNVLRAFEDLVGRQLGSTEVLFRFFDGMPHNRYVKFTLDTNSPKEILWVSLPHGILTFEEGRNGAPKEPQAVVDVTSDTMSNFDKSNWSPQINNLVDWPEKWTKCNFGVRAMGGNEIVKSLGLI